MFKISINCDGEEICTFYYERYANAEREFELFNKNGKVLKSCGIIKNYYVELKKED